MMTNRQEHAANIIRTMCGCSLKEHEQDYRIFMSRGLIDDTYAIINERISTCGLFGLAVWFALEVPHPLITTRYVTGKAITWICEIAQELGAVRYPKRDGPPTIGALMHYWSPGRNDNHVEFCLSEADVSPDGHWFAQHAGGGRALGAIGFGQGNIRWDSGQPLQEWYDLEALFVNESTKLVEPHHVDDEAPGVEHCLDEHSNQS